MKYRVGFALLLIIVTLGLVIWFTFNPLHTAIRVYALDKYENYPIEHEIKSHYSDEMKLSIYESSDALMAASIEDQPDVIVMDMMQYLYDYDDFSEYRIAYLRPKSIYFVLATDDPDITTINQIKDANVGVENYSSNEYLLDKILSVSGIKGLTMQEQLVSNSLLRMQNFLNGHLEFAFFESPYYESSLAIPSQTLNQFDHQYDVFLIKDQVVLSTLDHFVKTTNQAITGFNDTPPALSQYHGQLWIPKSFKSTDSHAFSTIKKAERHYIDKGLTWLYANQRIKQKYTDDELFFP